MSAPPSADVRFLSYCVENVRFVCWKDSLFSLYQSDASLRLGFGSAVSDTTQKDAKHILLHQTNVAFIVNNVCKCKMFNGGLTVL